MATETFAVGSSEVTVALNIDLPSGEQIITGDFSGMVPAGTIGRLRGDVRLLADLHVRGRLVADPDAQLDGKGFDIHTHDGGILDLRGTEKTAWCRWGDSPVGWVVGDRLAVAPTAVNVYTPSETTWQGSWAATVRPSSSPDVTLVDGSIARPEVANLSQSLILKNLDRIMVHEANGLPNVHTLKWLKILDSGKSVAEAGELGHYPLHFHLLGNSARGSLVQGVVVEGGKLHAFVPHGSHGISFPGCVAYKTTGDAFWWDQSTPTNTANDSNDTDWSDCLVMHVLPSPNSLRLTGFIIGAGANCKCNRSVATGVAGFLNFDGSRSGFNWPEEASRGPWEFKDCVAHNNVENGTFAWQNNTKHHLIENLTTYRNGRTGINHGAYVNDYHYIGGSLTDDGMILHALSEDTHPILIRGIKSNARLQVLEHNFAFTIPTVFRDGSFSQVIYREAGKASWLQFYDYDLHPADFSLFGNTGPGSNTSINPGSVIEIFENDVLIHRWAGVWS